MSAGRKSPSVVMPVARGDDGRLTDLQCRRGGRAKKLTGLPWWKMVWPWLPMSAIFFVES